MSGPEQASITVPCELLVRLKVGDRLNFGRLVYEVELIRTDGRAGRVDMTRVDHKEKLQADLDEAVLLLRLTVDTLTYEHQDKAFHLKLVTAFLARIDGKVLP